MISAPVVAPEPVAKIDASGNKLTKSQRKKLKKKRRKAEKRVESDSGVDTDAVFLGGRGLLHRLAENFFQKFIWQIELIF